MYDILKNKMYTEQIENVSHEYNVGDYITYYKIYFNIIYPPVNSSLLRSDKVKRFS